jgi:Flp pilus assembly protein TadD
MQLSPHKVFGQTAQDTKNLEKARTACRTALRAKPYDIDCMNALGLIECQLGNPSAAKQWFKKAVGLKPDRAEIQANYGFVLIEEEEYAEAIVTLRHAVALAPRHIEAAYHLGLALSKTGQLDEAAAVYRQVLILKPDYVEALNSLGNLLFDQGKPRDAIVCFQRALAVRPDYVMGYNNMGLVLAALGELDDAEAQYRKAISLMPNYPEAHNNLGVVFAQRGKFEESIGCYQQALALRPDYPEAHNNLGNALKDCGQIEDAITHYEKALRKQSSPDYRHNLALAQLAVGQFDQGWRNYEARWQTKALTHVFRNFTQPQWQGEEAVGRTILVHAEQGFGDTLQFCRYAPLIKARDMRVIMEVPPALVKIIGSLDGVNQVIAEGQDLPDFDLHCPMMSLPLAFATKLGTIPASIPYLAADQKDAAAWQSRLPDAKGALRVGLVWEGNARTQTQDLAAANRRRSIAPELLAPIIEVPGVQFYSLQKVGAPAPEHFGLIDTMSECNDFAATAALIANLDLIISVDTAVVHLAGAMGKPVWGLNRFSGCWRWLRGREDSPWYPTLRLFHQKSAGDWKNVIEQVRSALMRRVA